MDTALEALKEQCLQEIQRNVTLQSSPIAASILANSCPNQCSQNGLCINGMFCFMQRCLIYDYDMSFVYFIFKWYLFIYLFYDKGICIYGK